ncbi:hypothetical protein WJX72_004043 [[Myrmecia] bisecta]|uniref:Uncharacterized protein n=1 Tax=[Myrmecia] bisecta TaxID=41462 RepID=A0AAW1PKB5_9CHLO
MTALQPLLFTRSVCEAQIKEESVVEEAGADLFNTLQEQLAAADSRAVVRTTEEAGSLASATSDELLQASLSQRIESLATSVPRGEQEGGPLTGRELRKLVCAKYGKNYDLSIVRRDIPGKTLIRLNVMWTHLEQRSFPMTPEDYVDKLETIAYYVSAWGQEETVRAFFKEKPKALRGLPARPVVGSAISIRLDLPDAVIEEWFGRV